MLAFYAAGWQAASCWSKMKAACRPAASRHAGWRWPSPRRGISGSAGWLRPQPVMPAGRWRPAVHLRWQAISGSCRDPIINAKECWLAGREDCFTSMASINIAPESPEERQIKVLVRPSTSKSHRTKKKTMSELAEQLEGNCRTSSSVSDRRWTGPYPWKPRRTPALGLVELIGKREHLPAKQSRCAPISRAFDKGQRLRCVRERTVAMASGTGQGTRRYRRRSRERRNGEP